MKPENQFRREGQSLEQDIKNIPEKGGLLGALLIILIVTGILGIIILAVLLLRR